MLANSIKATINICSLAFQLLWTKILCGFLGSSALKCYQCTSMNGDCTNGQCEGVWCVEQMVRGSGASLTESKWMRLFEENSNYIGKVMVKKDCSPANNLVSGKEECLKSSLDGAETVNCICNQDLCNNVDYLKRFPAFSTDNSGNLSGTLPQNLLTTGGQTDSNIIGSSSGALPGEFGSMIAWHTNTLTCTLTHTFMYLYLYLHTRNK